MAIAFGLFGLNSGQPLLLLIALFVWIGAEGEARQVEERVALKDLPVRTAMLTDFHTLTPHDTLGHAADLLLAGTQHDFPVASTVDHAYEVLLTRAELLAGLTRAGRDALVGDHARTEISRVEAGSPLIAAVTRLREGRRACLQVVEDAEPVGLLTLENVGEFLMVREASSAKAGQRVRKPLPPHRLCKDPNACPGELIPPRPVIWKPHPTPAERLGRVAESDASFRRVGSNWVGKCLICNGPLAFDIQTGEGATLEHIRARSRGGTDDIENLAIVHGRCNWEKGRNWDPHAESTWSTRRSSHGSSSGGGNAGVSVPSPRRSRYRMLYRGQGSLEGVQGASRIDTSKDRTDQAVQSVPVADTYGHLESGPINSCTPDEPDVFDGGLRRLKPLVEGFEFAQLPPGIVQVFIEYDDGAGNQATPSMPRMQQHEE